MLSETIMGMEISHIHYIMGKGNGNQVPYKDAIVEIRALLSVGSKAIFPYSHALSSSLEHGKNRRVEKREAKGI